MTDRDLLKFAAKAAGKDHVYWSAHHEDWYCIESGSCWMPLDHDGDALRLMVKLGMFVDSDPSTACTRVLHNNRNYNGASELHNDDPYAATRRAIVRAAAQIGKGMK